jgi:hypothetical protein
MSSTDEGNENFKPPKLKLETFPLHLSAGIFFLNQIRIGTGQLKKKKKMRKMTA